MSTSKAGFGWLAGISEVCSGEEAGSSEQFHAIKESPKMARVLNNLFFMI
jgi:hypothetical protein